MNQTTVAGHLGADPEVRFTSSGQKVTTLRVAARVRRTAKDETIWWRVTVWGEQFDKMMPYLKKGSPVIAVGEMNKPEIFTDKEGRAQVSMSLTASDLLFSPFGRPDQQGGDNRSAAVSQEPAFAHTPGETSYGQGRMPSTFSEDEIPF
ncbi:MAG: single-stranded DNA-binding protein [Chlamydiota bacterium]